MSSESQPTPPVQDMPLRELKRHVVIEHDADILTTNFRNLSPTGNSYTITVDPDALRMLGLLEEGEIVPDGHQVRTAICDNGILLANLQPPWQL